MIQRYLDLYDELLNPGPSVHGSPASRGTGLAEGRMRD
jgi:hypothetical protein